jgi:hypothetical protein
VRAATIAVATISNQTGSIALIPFHNAVKAFLYGVAIGFLAIGLARNRTPR